MIFTGGTIESVGVDRLDRAWYRENESRLSDAELLTRVPELRRLAHVEVVAFGKFSSSELVDSDWLRLLRLIHHLAERGDLDGVVVTHGTNTLEETAYFLHLTAKTRLPIVLVGAMRPASALSADGDLNLFNAVAVAASPQACGQGVLVVMNEAIFSAREVTKSATYRVQAFVARTEGPLGHAEADGQVHFAHRVCRPHTSSTEFEVADRTTLPRVDVLVSYIGADGALVEGALAAGARGLVGAGTGAGRFTGAEHRAFQRARERGVAVVIATRVGSGRVVRSPELVKHGFVAAGDLQPWKARLLLSLGLTSTNGPEQLQRMFDIY